MEKKTPIVNETTVKFASHITTWRTVGNQLTQVVQERIDDGSDKGRLVTSTVTTVVTPLDEETMIKDPRYQRHMARLARRRNGEILLNDDFGTYNERVNFYPDEVVPNQGFTLQEVINRFASGVPDKDKNNGLSYDEDLPFIDSSNYYKLGGPKIVDFSEIPTKYQSAYKHNRK